jgi:hypothetical protein
MQLQSAGHTRGNVRFWRPMPTDADRCRLFVAMDTVPG